MGILRKYWERGSFNCRNVKVKLPKSKLGIRFMDYSYITTPCMPSNFSASKKGQVK